jgi:hypothetical protein
MSASCYAIYGLPSHILGLGAINIRLVFNYDVRSHVLSYQALDRVGMLLIPRFRLYTRLFLTFPFPYTFP